MYCGLCGKEIQDDLVYCPYCGKKLNKDNNMTGFFIEPETLKGFLFNGSFLLLILSLICTMLKWVKISSGRYEGLKVSIFRLFKEDLRLLHYLEPMEIGVVFILTIILILAFASAVTFFVLYSANFWKLKRHSEKSLICGRKCALIILVITVVTYFMCIYANFIGAMQMFSIFRNDFLPTIPVVIATLSSFAALKILTREIVECSKRDIHNKKNYFKRPGGIN